MSTIVAAKRVYHAVNPNERRRSSHERKKQYDGYYHDPDPRKLSNRSLRDHLCEPWYGCHKCKATESTCVFGDEYLRRVAAGEIAPLQFWVVTA